MLGRYNNKLARQVKLGLAVLLATAFAFDVGAADPGISSSIAILSTDLPLIENAVFGGESVSAATYREYYGLEFPGVTHSMGLFKAEGVWLAAQFFEPAGERRGCVVLVHGYLDHSHAWKHLARALLERGYAVAMFDLPGHGLSSGPRAEVHAFDNYSDDLAAFVTIATNRFPGPCHVVGHSTGASAILQLLSESRMEGIGRVVLVAPLVRSDGWLFTRATYWLRDYLPASLPRRWRKNSADVSRLEFVRQDPLQCRVVSMRWCHALIEWNRRFETVAPIETPVLVLQGTGDSTVDWKHGLEVLRNKLQKGSFVEFKGGGHQLMNEAEPMRSDVVGAIVKYLDEPAVTPALDAVHSHTAQH